MITSTQNQVVKDIKALSRKKDRMKSGRFVAEGLRFVMSAIQMNAKIDAIVYSDAVYRTEEGTTFINELIEKAEYKVLEIEEKIFGELSDTQSPQGIMALVHQPKFTWEQIMKPHGFLIILDRIQDPGNLGTIIRTADAAGADGVILLKGTVDAYNPKVLRSTMGSVFEMPVIEGVTWEETFNNLSEAGYTFAATALEKSVEYDSVDYTKSSALIIGNEANGISDEIISQSDIAVKIPIVGSAESLNAGVAAAVMMYEVLRQRRKN